MTVVTSIYLIGLIELGQHRNLDFGVVFNFHFFSKIKQEKPFITIPTIYTYMRFISRMSLVTLQLVFKKSESDTNMLKLDAKLSTAEINQPPL